jgi:prolyl-tRNA editing enzyme YbaK/EbsC (Cys-tRNA(Pro) deacylase)
MRPASHPDALRVQQVLGAGFTVVEFSESTHSSAEAAAAIGCSVAQIAKSIIFRGAVSGRPVLVVASGANRVDEKKVTAVIGEKVKSADAVFVLVNTGFAIGGVPPVGHTVAPIIVIDQDLSQHEDIWAAGGCGNAVFCLSFAQLKSLTSGVVSDIVKVK